ncbi:MAG: DUF305 domain-containing protein [Candidatus Paceibacterota bacterium]|nr:MAG: DUF305 domain-containing protein [Candidatus Paceibacterota bacterium]
MNSKISFILIGVVGIFIGILIAPIFSGNLMMGFTPGKKLAPTTSLGNIDRHFIEEMIPHHNGAIAMAELALERSGREEIRSLSEDIIKAQTLENNQMKEWYQAWFGGEVPESFSGMSGMMHGQMPMHMEGMEGDIEALLRAENFDLEFLRQMILHHEMAIMMARMLSTGSVRSEMQILADQIITSQSEEIEIMRNWQKEWSKK